MVVAAACLFALNGTVSKLLMRGGFDAPGLTAFRAAGAVLGLVALGAVLRPGPRRFALRRSELPRLLVYGLAGYFVVPMTYFIAITRLGVGIGLLFEFTAPLLVALWVRFGQRQPVRRRLWVGLALCLAGLACVAQIWVGELRLDPVGVLIGMISAVLLALYYVVGARSVADREPLSLTAWAFGISAVAGMIVRPWWDLPPGILNGTSDGIPMWLLAGYLVIFGTLVPYLLVAAALRHLPATSVGIIGMLEVVVAAAVAWAALGEVLALPQVLGGGLVLIGVVLAETARTLGPQDHPTTLPASLTTPRGPRPPELPPG
jgi:drug/metabolite transporter (DMT)-like permease